MMYSWLIPESFLLWGGLGGYAAGTMAAWDERRGQTDRHRYVLAGLTAGVILFAAAVAQRWMTTGHGPFLTLYEVLLSNLFSLGFLYALAYWRVPQVRPGAVVALPVLVLLGAWSATVSSESGQLPATYDNFWLWIHVITGKVFLAACLVAFGLAGMLLRRRIPPLMVDPPSLSDETLNDVAWRFMGLAFVFDTLMLVAGAAWARDAWGRYWAWDPLETWAFLTWLLLGVALHLRASFRLPEWIGCGLIAAVFLLALLTFVGIPFISVAAHKGVM